MGTHLSEASRKPLGDVISVEGMDTYDLIVIDFMDILVYYLRVAK